ncbi:MAG: hypothetical protein M3542_08885, partial [Acidobacteriota bacterium]|nr:hypothetical protein [Acidobacteriota bacterium]
MRRSTRLTLLASAVAFVFLSPASMAEYVKETVLRGNGNDVNAVAFSPDGKILASGHKQKFAKLWSVPDGR